MRPPLPPNVSRAALGAIILLSLSQLAAAVSAVLGIDVGQEFIKAALIKPGIPLDIVLTKDTKRKEASAVGFKPHRLSSSTDGTSTYTHPERLYGADAVNLAARFPHDVYPNLKQLLGKHVFNQAVMEYSERYPALNIFPSPKRHTPEFRSVSAPPAAGGGGQQFSVEELLAMQLRAIQKNAETMGGKGAVIRDVVFTVPAFFTAEERYALQLAAEIAGLKVLALISDGLAVGVQYATSRTYEPGGKPETHIIYDMGAGSTTATVVRFAGKTVKDVGKATKNVTEVSVLGVGWDTSLGGDLFNKHIAQHLLEEFVETPKGKAITNELGSDPKDIVRLNGRAAAKLWQAATKVRHVLSANTQRMVSIESLFDDIDFKSDKITRSQFEDWIAEYKDRIVKPIQDALEAAGMKLDGIDSLLLHGGAHRVPFVGGLLEGLVGEAKISKTINPEEAAVFGATYRGAAMSRGFRGKEIRVQDRHVYEVLSVFKEQGIEEVSTKTVFPANTPLGSETILPLRSRTEDFSIALTHSLSSRTEVITQVQTQNLTASIQKLNEDFKCTPEHVVTEFSIRIREKDGIPEVLGAWAGCNVTLIDIPDPVEKQEGGGILDDVKGFFGLKNKEKDAGAGAEEISTTTVPSADSASSSSTGTPETPTTSQQPGIVFNVQEGEPANLYPGHPDKKVITKMEKVPLELKITKGGLPEMTADEIKASVAKLDAFDKIHNDRVERDASFNTLESFVYRINDLLNPDSGSSFIGACPLDILTTLATLTQETMDWLYDSAGGDIASREDIEKKLARLQELEAPVSVRRKENEGREEKIKDLRESVNHVNSLLLLMEETVKAENEARELSRAQREARLKKKAEKAAGTTPKDGFEELDDDPQAGNPVEEEEEKEEPEKPLMYSPADIVSLKSLAEDTAAWLEEKVKAQEGLKLYEDPVVTLQALDEKTRLMNAKVMEVLQKKMLREEKEKKERERKEKEKEEKKKRERKERRDKEKEAKERKRKEKEDVKQREGKEKEGKEERKHEEL